MSPSELQQAHARISSVAELTALHAILFQARLLKPPPSLGTKIHAEQSINHQVRPEKDGFSTIVTGVVNLSPDDERDAPYASFTYATRQAYRLPDELHDPEVVRKWAISNGTIHYFPYLRAFVTQSAATLGLPPIHLPVFRVREHLKETADRAAKPPKSPPRKKAKRAKRKAKKKKV